MALQGTIDTFDLSEVIRMLSQGEKTGRLGVSGDPGSGSLWFAEGRLVASETDFSAPTGDHSDVLFQLLRFSDGSFVFERGAESVESGSPVEIDPLLEEADRRLQEWSEIVAVVPSMRHRVALRADLPRSDVVLDQDSWQVVATIGGGTTVGELGDQLDLDELAVGRSVKTLVELGVIDVLDEEPAEATSFPDAVEPEDPVTFDDVFPTTPEGSGPAEVPAVSSGFEPDWLGEVAPGAATTQSGDDTGTARDQLDALASGFGMQEEPAGVDVPPSEPEPVVEADQPLEFGDPVPLAGADEEGAGSFPIEVAEAAGEARTPLFAHDPDPSSAPSDDGQLPSQPGEAAEVARQLANLSPEAARAVAAAARATTDEEREAALAIVTEDGEEPLDPDLLRSFLSSVRQ